MLERLIDPIKELYAWGVQHSAQMLIALAVFIIIFILGRSLARIVINIVLRLLKNTKNKKSLKSELTGPFTALVRVIGAYISLLIIGLPESVFSYIHTGFRISVIAVIAWLCASFMPPLTSAVMKHNEKNNKKANAAAMVFLSNILKVIIAAIAAVAIVDELGYNINGLITGLGLGGLTFSLAAQKTASNLFGGFALISDKPFDVGDRITTPSVDGTVEDITMRSTRIRTAENSVIIIPNSKLVEEPITNWSKIKKRLVDFTAKLSCNEDTSSVIECIEKIKDMLNEHPDVHDNSINVYLESFSEASYNIRIKYFTKTTEFNKYIEVKEDVNIRLKNIMDSIKN
ncbi:MAG: mechanosensitive ion channel family protein [Oscillospiraceae bacterium]|jgi:MscS family membrane protein|nr:mechanosensitive ion channel family protein [Oscillospiraceae bacterium]